MNTVISVAGVFMLYSFARRKLDKLIDKKFRQIESRKHFKN